MPEFDIEAEIWVALSLVLEGTSIDPNVAQSLVEFILTFLRSGGSPDAIGE